MKEIGVGSIVRYKGPSPLCDAPQRHKHTGAGIGVVTHIEANGKVHGHDIHIEGFTGKGWARADELEPIDEWGVTTRKEESCTKNSIPTP